MKDFFVNSKKLRLLIMGCILIILGTALYFTIGGQVRLLVLSVAGIALLVVGIVYPNRVKQEAVTK